MYIRTSLLYVCYDRKEVKQQTNAKKQVSKIALSTKSDSENEQRLENGTSNVSFCFSPHPKAMQSIQPANRAVQPLCPQ